MNFSLKKRDLFFFSQILLACISPILALPWILISIYNRDTRSIYLLALVSSYIICAIPPTGDAYHYYEIFQRTTFDDVFRHKDILFYLLSCFCKSVGISYYVMRFFLVLFSITSVWWVFLDISKNNALIENEKKFFLIVLLVFFSINYFWLAWGIRYNVMYILLLIGCYLLSTKRIWGGIGSITAGLLMHFSGFMFLPAILFGVLFQAKTFSFAQKIALSVLCLIIGQALFGFVYQRVPEFLVADSYITGYWSTANSTRVSFKGRIFWQFYSYILPTCTIFLYFLCKSVKSIFTQITFFIVLTYWSVWHYEALTARICHGWIFIALSVLLTFPLKKYVLWGILSISIFTQGMLVYTNRESILTRETMKAVASPVVLFFQHDYDDVYFFQRGEE